MYLVITDQIKNWELRTKNEGEQDGVKGLRIIEKIPLQASSAKITIT